MADVVGLIAASGQFIEQGNKIIKLYKDLHDRVRDVPTEMPKRIEVVEDLIRLCEGIKTRPSLETSHTLHALEACTNTAEELCKLFRGITFTADDPLSHKTWMAIVGKAKDSEINNKFHELEGHKASLGLGLGLATHDQTQAILSKLDEPQVPFLLTSEEDQCIRELFVTDPSADRDRIISDKGEITQGTCEWVLKEDSFKSWESTSPHLLWISAPPGMGKTYLSIFLSRHLEPESQQTAESATIYFFCDNKRAAQNTGINILRGLIYQLTQLRRELVKVLLSPWKAQSKLLFAPNALESLWQVFQHMIAALGDTYQTIHCLLDGMDECEDTSLSSLLVKLRSIANDRQTSGPTFKFIGVSRRYPDHIPRSLISFISLEIDESGRAKRDVERYIATQVMDLARKKNIVNSPLQSHIERIFKDRAEGTFLWVSFMVKDLESKSIAQIETALEDLPRGLDAVYDKIIAQMDPGKLELVTKLLQWIAFAKVPLTIPALCEAIGVNGTELLTREQVCLDYIQSCGHLLLTTKVDITKNMNIRRNAYGLSASTSRSSSSASVSSFFGSSDSGSVVSLSSHRQLAVAFVHQSAKDYLLQSTLAIRIGDSESNHKMIADRLLRYLRNGCLDSNVFLNFARFKAFPLAGYAIPCWEYHFSQIVNISPLMKEHDTFFGTNTTLRGPWIDHSDMGRILFGHCGSQEHDIPLLHLACVMGLENLVRHILYGPKWMFVDRLRRKTTVNRQWGSYRYTPLHWATEYGHLGIIRMLLDCGASADKANFDEKTPFHHVLRSNHSDAFKILAESKSGKALLEAGNGSELSQHNLLYHAAANGRTEICRLLIEDYKWDSNTKSSRHAYSPIDIAIICGHIPLARTFATRWGGRCHKHFNVLHSLTFDGPSSSYRIMVNNIMRSMDQMHSPASTIRKEAFVASFKSAVHEWKLDINDTDMNGRNILQGWVLTFKNLDFFSVQVRTALTHGVDPGHRDKKGRATIHLLSQRVDFPKVVVELEVLSLLLDKERLPINATDKLGRTMLHIYFREALGRANENDPEKLYPWFDRPASDYELSQFMPAMVERLLDHGLNRHLKSSTGKTALDLAQRVLDSYLLPAEMLGNLASTLSVDSLPQRRQKFINAPPDFFLPEHREEFISIIEDVVDILKNYETVPVE